MQIQKHIEVKVAGKTVAFLSPTSDGLKDIFIDTRLNGESTLEFSLPSDNEKNNELTPECEIYAGDKVYNLLKEDCIDEAMDEGGKVITKYMAVERFNELDNIYPEPYITNDPYNLQPADLFVIIVSGGSDLSNGQYLVGSAAHALHAVLKGTNWKIGVCDVTGIHDLEMEKVSVLQLIKQIQDTWGGFIVWDSLNRIIHLRDSNQWKNYTGFQVKYAKNLKHITKTQSNKLITKIYCFGKDNLDIASVNDGVKYVTDFSYTNNVYSSIYSDPDIENAEELKQKGIAELQLNSKPKYNYQIKMVDLRTLPEYSHEEFMLGDMVDVINSKMNIEANVRILRHRYNVFEPWKCELELGDPAERLVEKLKASFDTTGFIDNTFNSLGEMSGKKLVDGTVIGNAIADAALEASKFNTKQLILTGDIWQNNTPSAGFVAWNSHKLFYDGKEYTISGANTNKKYIVWQKDISPTLYQTYTQAEFDNLTLKDYDWVIAINNSGIHDIAWYSRIARQFIASAFIADLAVKTVKIEDAAIVSAKIAQLAVQSAHIAFAAITNAKIQDLAVTNLKIGDLQIDERTIANWAISTDKIQDLAVTNAKIDSLEAGKITAGIIKAEIEMISPKIIGGEIIGGKITSDSTIDVKTNLQVGNEINVGDWNDRNDKKIRFAELGGLFWHGDSDTLSVSSPRVKLETEVSFNGFVDFTNANVTGITARFA